MNKKKVLNIVLSAVFVAIIAVLTAFCSIKIGVNGGYVHFGDSVIYIVSCLLPPPYAILTASLGGAMADILSGAVMWAPATIIVKALNTIPFIIMYKFMKDKTKIVTVKTVSAILISGLITLFGYGIAEILMFGLDFGALWGLMLLQIAQPIGSGIIFVLFGKALDKIKFKEKFKNENCNNKLNTF